MKKIILFSLIIIQSNFGYGGGYIIDMYTF